jgi:hypothetical protein
VWTNFRIVGDPFSVCFFFQHLLRPFGLLGAVTGIVIIALATETEHFSTGTLHRFQKSSKKFDTMIAISSCTILILSA